MTHETARFGQVSAGVAGRRRNTIPAYNHFMKYLLPAVIVPLCAMAQSLSLTDGWSTWAPRPEISPKAYLDPIHARGGKASLALTGESNPGVFGGWERVVDGVQPEGWYRFQA